MSATARRDQGKGRQGGFHDHAIELAGRGTVASLALALGLNAVYTVVEAAAGFATGSLALLADAGHNLSDVA